MSGLSTPPSAATTPAVIPTEKRLQARNGGSRMRPRRMRSLESFDSTRPPIAMRDEQPGQQLAVLSSQVAAT